MEGVAGIARDEQTDPASPHHAAGRHLLTQEVNAAIEGALEAGAQEIVVRESRGHQAARSLHPGLARQRIKAGARRAMQRLATIPPLRLEGRAELEVDFVRPAMADSAERVPGVLRVAPRTVAYAAEDYL